MYIIYMYIYAYIYAYMYIHIFFFFSSMKKKPPTNQSMFASSAGRKVPTVFKKLKMQKLHVNRQSTVCENKDFVVEAHTRYLLAARLRPRLGMIYTPVYGVP